MPYPNNADLPSRLRDNLPEYAQSIGREAFNHAYQEYQNPAQRRGEASHKVARSELFCAHGRKIVLATHVQ
jgi:cation transport regulator